MGVKCKSCGTDNGITHYVGKVCKRCGKVLMDKADWRKCLGIKDVEEKE